MRKEYFQRTRSLGKDKYVVIQEMWACMADSLPFLFIHKSLVSEIIDGKWADNKRHRQDLKDAE